MRCGRQRGKNKKSKKKKERKRKQALDGEAGGEDIRVSQSLTAATLFASSPTVSASLALQIQNAGTEELKFCHVHVFKVAAVQKEDEQCHRNQCFLLSSGQREMNRE